LIIRQTRRVPTFLHCDVKHSLINYKCIKYPKIGLNSRPELKKLQAEKKANQNDIAISRSGYMPRVSLYYNYGSDYSSNYRRFSPADSLYHEISFEDQLLKDNYSHQYGFNISIPIFNRLQTRTNVVRSKIGYENSKLEYQDFEMQLIIDVQNAYQDFKFQKETYLANRIRAEASMLAYEKQQEMYRMGKGSLVDLNVENKRKIEAQSEEAQAKYNLVFQQLIVKYQLGDLKW
jgi:outer membrane protein